MEFVNWDHDIQFPTEWKIFQTTKQFLWSFAPVAAAGAVGTAPGVSPRPSCAGRSLPINASNGLVLLGKSSPETQGFYHHFVETQGFYHHFFGGCSCKFETIVLFLLKESIGKWLEDRPEDREDQLGTPYFWPYFLGIFPEIKA